MIPPSPSFLMMKSESQQLNDKGKKRKQKSSDKDARASFKKKMRKKLGIIENQGEKLEKQLTDGKLNEVKQETRNMSPI